MNAHAVKRSHLTLHNLLLQTKRILLNNLNLYLSWYYLLSLFLRFSAPSTLQHTDVKHLFQFFSSHWNVFWIMKTERHYFFHNLKLYFIVWFLIATAAIVFFRSLSLSWMIIVERKIKVYGAFNCLHIQTSIIIITHMTAWTNIVSGITVKNLIR